MSISASKKHGSIMALAGVLKGKASVKMSIEEMNQVIADGYVERGMRGLVRLLAQQGHSAFVPE